MSEISNEDIKIAISRAIDPSVKIVDHKIEAFSEEKNGMLGLHQLLTVRVIDERESNNNDVKTRTFFVKALPKMLATRDRAVDESLFFEEVHFYDKVRSHMTDNFKIERWSSKCYLAKPDLLVFEDLRAQGFVMLKDLLLEEKYLRSVLTTLARFHASSLLAEKRLGETLKQLFPDSFAERFITSEESGVYARMGFEVVAYIADKIGLDSSLAPKIYEKVHRDVRPREGRCNTVCHGDLWRNNILFDNSDPPNSLLVDFQIAKYTSPTIDVGMFLHLHTTRDFRKTMEIDLFEHYYSIFRDTLLANDRDIVIPSYETLLRDYRDCKIIAMSYAALYLPLICINHENLQELMKDQEQWHKFLYEDRITLIESNMKNDAAYEKRIKEIIVELIEEGQRIFQK